MKQFSEVLERQKPLISDYLIDPDQAWITDVAVIRGKNLNNPFNTEVIVNEELQVPLPIGVHRAVGGLHDAPNPGDILCASLASCFESTLRLVANRLGIRLVSTYVKATAEVDVRGTLVVEPKVPVGFQKMALTLDIKVEPTRRELLKALIKGTEHSCIIYQTLRKSLPITIESKIEVSDLISTEVA